MTSLSVSRLTRGADLSGARAVFLASFLHAYTPLYPNEPSLPQDPVSLRLFLEDAFAADVVDFQRKENPPRLYVATLAKPVGYLSADVIENGSVYLRQLSVLPDVRRCGVARALVKRALLDVSEVTKVTVSLRKFNSEAQRFYESLGFREDRDCHESLDSAIYKGMVWTPAAGVKY